MKQTEYQIPEAAPGLSKRIKFPEENSFEDVWKITNEVCDRYGIGNTKVIKFPAPAEMVMAA